MTPPDERPAALYDWNAPATRRAPIDVADASLSDGLQSPAAIDPSQRDKCRLLALSSEMGIRAAALGHPGSGPRQFADTLALAREVVRSQLPLDASASARATAKDVAPVLDVRERTGLDLEVAIALTASPLRLAAEGITIDRLQEVAETSVTFAVRAGARVVAVIEDVARTPPEYLAVLIRHLVSLGATALRLSDSSGHAQPDGARSLMRFVIGQTQVLSGPRVRLEWHGQNDRGLALANALAAVATGADRVHASALGLGERSGTVAIEQVLTNLRLLGLWPHTLATLPEYCDTAASAFGVAVAPSAPVIGTSAFRTGSGAHATALVKALRAGDRWLADNVTSAVPASLIGAEPRIDVSPDSGLSNVRWWLDQHGYDAGDLVLMRELLLAVKQTQRAATDDELHGLVGMLLAARIARV